MNIILDTNIFHTSFRLDSTKFKILFDYATKTHSKFILPEIVHDELAANYKRELLQKLNNFEQSRKKLVSFLPNLDVPEIELSIEEETNLYIQFVKKALQIDDKKIFGYKENYLREVISRAINRKRPCSDKGEEIRDAVLWLSVLDIAEEFSSDGVIFISQNTKQFALNDKLHPDLQEDLDNRKVELKYFATLDDFAQQHAVKIDFITNEWLSENINIDMVLKEAAHIVRQKAEEEALRQYSNVFINGYPTGYYNQQEGFLQIENTYIYEMIDGLYMVEAFLVGEVEVEVEIEKIIDEEEHDFEQDVDIDTGIINYIPTTRNRRKVDTNYFYVNPEVAFYLEIIIKDRNIEKWTVLKE